MLYRIQNIKEILTATGQIDRPEAEIEYLLTDSRNIIYPERSLFIAIKGKQHDGHRYITQTYQAGVINFIVEQLPDKQFTGVNFLLVENSVDALQKLAMHHRNTFNIDDIGITGSNGKTIVKEWIYHLLRSKRNICRNPKSYNSQIGVPLSVWNLEKENDLGMFEAGISLPNEMEKLQPVIDPTIGIFTNIGPAHDEGFANREEKIREKLKLFTGKKMRVLFYCCDQQEVKAAIKTTFRKEITRAWSMKDNPEADILVKNITGGFTGRDMQTELLQQKTTFDIVLSGRKLYKLEIPFPDEASLENAVNAIIVADCLGMGEDELREGLKTLPTVSMRLELKKGIHNCQVINDVYSADISSLEIALHFLRNNKQNLHTHVILSDIDESGADEKSLYSEVASLLAENKVDFFTGIGEAITRQRKSFEKIKDLTITFYPNTEAYVQQFNPNDFHDQFILLKGARRFRLERINNLLAQKTHGTVLQINLNHLVHNLNVYRSLIDPHVKTMAMVKAFSYGSGTSEIASVLAHHHVDYLAVAYTDEGIELRKNGIHLPIMVMNAEPDTFEHLLQYKLEPEIYNFRILHLLLEFLKGKTIADPVNIHLKIETGMHRLGFEADETDKLLSLIDAHPEIKIVSIFSHLSAADEEIHDTFTQEQISLFKKISDHMISHISYQPLRHILNSAGISKFPDAQFDMVRLGIGLYGDDPSKSMQQKLLPVSTLTATVSQIKNVPAGESIGYARGEFATKDMRIATINIGYADGFSRKLSNGAGSVYLNGKYAPVVGRVCMDMIMVDVTNTSNIHEGDETEIFGPHISIQQFAEWMQTIPYEVMTGISQRVKRVYIQE
ncbi:MAG: bifunctional UDP-N-acetylmuramoyl-tripeptide:D-alanyl-D-alanine ligase/alanine racemase [Chitinophagales bacterium]|nr:bifunctional UDP-N-acetylmuramoyl-tripeptide:D-alanyl-D-alanine ligase/alanine racemase [Chitinophagales bacterium]